MRRGRDPSLRRTRGKARWSTSAASYSRRAAVPWRSRGARARGRAHARRSWTTAGKRRWSSRSPPPPLLLEPPPPPPPPQAASAPMSGSSQNSEYRSRLFTGLSLVRTRSSCRVIRNMPDFEQTTKSSPHKLRSRSRSMMARAMNRHASTVRIEVRSPPGGGDLFSAAFLAVGIGANLLIAPQGVGVFWPATGALFAFLLLYPVRYWTALFLCVLRRRAVRLSGCSRRRSSWDRRRTACSRSSSRPAVLGVGFMHWTVRGPISFARLRHVLAFAVGGAAVHAGLRFGRHVHPRRPAVRDGHAFWLRVQSWWIGDFLGALVITPILLTIGFHGFAHSRGRARRAYRDLRGFRRAGAAAGRGLPAQQRRADFAARRSVHRLSRCSCGSPCSAVRDAPRWRPRSPWPSPRSRPRAATVPSTGAYQLQTFLALCVLPVLLLQAVMAERDFGDRRRTPQRRALPRLHRQQLRGDLPHRARRADADHAARPTSRSPGCANMATWPSATPRSWWRSA